MTSSRRLATCVSTSCILGGLALAPGIASANGGLAAELGAGVNVDRQAETAKVGFIGTEPGAAIDVGLSASASAAEVAKRFIDSHARSFGIGGAGASLETSETSEAAGNGTAVHLQQLQNGLPVLGGELVVNLNGNGEVRSVLGEASPSTAVSSLGTVTADEARAAAIATVAREKGVSGEQLSASVPRLSVYDPRLFSAPGPLQQARIAWALEVTSAATAPEPIDVFAVVDAELGVVALHFDQLETALDRSVCDAANSATKYPCSAPFARVEGDPATGNSDVDQAYDYAGDTYDFFFSRFGRDSLDGAGFPLLATVRYCPSSCPFQNAFWDGSQMVYGQGFAADDVVGHELTHGFTGFTSHLFYYAQSGAINESISDVFGEFVDLTNSAGTDTAATRWQVGEDIAGLGVIRDMQDPTVFDDPDRIGSTKYTADVTEADLGGVHSNSGVNNKAAYLITDGETFNGHAVSGIGVAKAARIYYEAATAMLGSASDYADLANALNQACTNLISTDAITGGNCTNVAKAVSATEMAANPTSAPTATAPRCSTGTPAAVFSDDLEDASSGNWTAAAAAGSNAWFYPQNPNPIFDATYATSGTTNIWGYDRPTVSDSAIAMTGAVAIPAGAYMRFSHSYGFEDNDSAAFDGGVLEYSTSGPGGPWIDAGSLFDSASGYNGEIAPGDNPLAGRSAFVRESNGYGASRLDLSSLAGEEARFRFRIGSNGLLDDYGWFIDDISIYTCETAGRPPPALDTTPPDTRIGSGPARRTKKRRARFGFSSSEPGSSFRCALDKARFTRCASPTRVRVKRGRHTFSVRAEDAAGNVDPSRAKYLWKVRRKGKRR